MPWWPVAAGGKFSRWGATSKSFSIQWRRNRPANDLHSSVRRDQSVCGQKWWREKHQMSDMDLTKYSIHHLRATWHLALKMILMWPYFKTQTAFGHSVSSDWSIYLLRTGSSTKGQFSRKANFAVDVTKTTKHKKQSKLSNIDIGYKTGHTQTQKKLLFNQI